MKRNKLFIGSATLLLSVMLLGACGNGDTKETKSKSSDTAQSSTEKKEKVDLNKLELPQLNK